MRVESAHPPSLNGAGMVYLLSKKEATEMERLPSLTNESINQYHRGRKMKPCYIHTFPFADPHRTGQIFDIVCVCVFMKAAFKGCGCNVTLGSPALEIQFAVTELYCRHKTKQKQIE